jgi:hypothetical protein
MLAKIDKKKTKGSIFRGVKEIREMLGGGVT